MGLNMVHKKSQVYDARRISGFEVEGQNPFDTNVPSHEQVCIPMAEYRREEQEISESERVIKCATSCRLHSPK